MAVAVIVAGLIGFVLGLNAYKIKGKNAKVDKILEKLGAQA